MAQQAFVMEKIFSGVRAVLSDAKLNRAFQNLLSARGWEHRFIGQFIRDDKPKKLLDLACGTAELLSFYPAHVQYVGIDISQPYVDEAQRIYGSRGSFYCRDLTLPMLDLGTFDVVTAIGFLHHLDDDQVIRVLSSARDAMKPGGEFVTLDPHFFAGQNPISRFLTSQDRGQHVRRLEDYRQLVRSVFPNAKDRTYNDFLWLPYDHISFSAFKAND